MDVLYDSGGGGGSSDQARAYHSITIGNKNTWDDWHLVPSSRPSFAMPQVKTSYIDLPGGDGVLDLTTSLTGRPMYGNRQGSFEFIVMNDYGEWYERYSDIATYLHGKEYRAILDDDPEYYYEGRFAVNQWKTGKNYSTITINYNVGPYKRSVLSSGDKWLWDPFHFVSDEDGPASIIYTYKNVIVTGQTEIVYVGEIYETSPIFSCSKYNDLEFSMSVTLNGKTQSLRVGTNVMETMEFVQGDNVIVFNGTGVVSIENTGGRL